MGSSGRVGYELTKHYLSKHYLVIAQCFRNCIKLEPLKESHENLRVLRHDFINSGINELFGRLRELDQKLDAAIIIHPLFHQSKNLLSKPISNVEKEINEVIRANLVAPLTLIYGFPSFMKEGASMVLLTDLLPSRGLNIYPTLKPSLIQLASSAALQAVISEAPKEMPKGIRYYAVATGWLGVPGLRDEDLRAITDTVPIGRAGSIDELVTLLDFLIEEAPPYLTGAVIRFSGGL